jgi:hypothetical protein
MYVINYSWSDYVTDVNGIAGFRPREAGEQSGTRMGPRQMKALKSGCMDMA